MDINKPKVLIIYHSGAGSTKTIAEIFYEKLDIYSIDIDSVSLNYDYNKLLEYDFLILAFPTYHCEPSITMKEFIENMPALSEQKKAFVITTCGLYSGNAVRILIKEALKKNIVTCGSSIYRAPASDGSLLFPSFKFMFKYEKNIVYKLRKDIDKIHNIIKTNHKTLDCPTFKMYTLLNFPNKALGKAYKHSIKLIKNNCIICQGCVRSCIRGCWQIGDEYPKHSIKDCEFCFKCIHHCPSNAIILSKKTLKKPKLNSKFYDELKKKTIEDIDVTIKGTEK